MTRLTDQQQTRLLGAFMEVDALLGEVTCVLERAARNSHFARDAPDATAIQRRLADEYVNEIRAAMRAVLHRHTLEPPQPRGSALQRARGAVDRAIVAVEELGPRYMVHCGPVDEELRGELNRTVSGLLHPLECLRVHLTPATSGSLREHARALPGSTDDGHRLGVLTRLVDTFELTRFVPIVEAMLERVERSDIEIAVFGRVNAGKSSLLNQLLGAPVLPVGSIPVTALPIQVAYGPDAWGFATFADAAPEKFSLDRLAEFAGQRFNPDNRRHVMTLRIELPAPLLREGITLIDVPGRSFERFDADALTEGPASRCDVGLVLLDAAAGLTLEEGRIVDALVRAGARVLVLITKADQLRDEDRWHIHGHVWHGLTALVGFDVPVYFASTAPGHRAEYDEWLIRGLRPLLEQRAHIRQASLQRKLCKLQRVIALELQHRLSLLPTRMDPRTERWERAMARIAEARRAIDSELAIDFAAARVADAETHALIDEVAFNGALLWSQGQGPSIDVTTLVMDSLRARAAGTANHVVKTIAKLEACCRAALAGAGATVGMTRADVDLARAAKPPLFASLALEDPIVPKLGMAPLGPAWRRRAIRRWLRQEPLHDHIRQAFSRHFAAVADWRVQALRRLKDLLLERSHAIQTQRAEAVRWLVGLPSREGPSDEARGLLSALRELGEVNDHVE